MKKIDKLIDRIIEYRCPISVGLDPNLDLIPDAFKKDYYNCKDPFKAIENIFFNFNKSVIDVIYDQVPAIKPQIAFYEAYGLSGIKAFQKTVDYAHKMGLIVIEDGKRNDISSTAAAYATGHLGVSKLLTSSSPAFNVDFLTVNPYLGSDGLDPFIIQCELYEKGIFILVKTSNDSGHEIQNAKVNTSTFLYENIAKYINCNSYSTIGNYGYSSIGAVVGATFPEEAKNLRKLMPKSLFLVPGYGAQGGTAEDVVSCFNSDGLGAIINSSRGIIYSYMNDSSPSSVSFYEFEDTICNAVQVMKNNINQALHAYFSNMVY